MPLFYSGVLANFHGEARAGFMALKSLFFTGQRCRRQHFWFGTALISVPAMHKLNYRNEKNLSSEKATATPSGVATTRFHCNCLPIRVFQRIRDESSPFSSFAKFGPMAALLVP